MATPREIIDQVPVRFDKALREGDVFYFPSTIHKHMEKDIEVILDLDLSRCW
jgi:sulfate adenylyltransferase (ADP) / ATP adenylyltransferase